MNTTLDTTALDDTALNSDDACESSYCATKLHRGPHRADYFLGCPCGDALTVCAERVLMLGAQPRVLCQLCGGTHNTGDIAKTPIT